MKKEFYSMNRQRLMSGLPDTKIYSGHYLGFDVHDVGNYRQSLAEGMVLTVDTGIYLKEWNVALRVEDDVVITKDGCIDLSKDVLREIPDIEAFMASR